MAPILAGLQLRFVYFCRRSRYSHSVWETLHAAFHRPQTRAYRWTAGVVWSLITVSVALLLAEPFLGEGRLAQIAHRADQVILALFALELGMRVLTFEPPPLKVFHTNFVTRVRLHVVERLKFLLRPMQLIDLAAVIAVVPELRGLRILRLLRLLRSARLFKHGNPFEGLVASFESDRILFLFAFSVLGIETIIGGLSIYLVEHGAANAEITSAGEGLWWALVTLTTVGYGDYAPVSNLGRVIGAVLMVGGMFTLALFAGIVGHTLLNAVLSIREEQFRMSGYVNHIVVFGYERGSTLLLKTLQDEMDLHEHRVVLFADHERPPEVAPSFLWVQGDPTKESELDKVRLTHASAAIIVGSRQLTPQQADAATILTAFTIRSHLAQQAQSARRKKPLHMVVEILDSENVAHARAAGANEVIESRRLGFSLLAHTVRYPGSADATATMVAVGDQNLYVGAAPADLAGKTFAEVSAELRARLGVLTIGYGDPQTSSRRLNPSDDTVVPPGAQLVYLAEKPWLG